MKNFFVRRIRSTTSASTGELSSRISKPNSRRTSRWLPSKFKWLLSAIRTGRSADSSFADFWPRFGLAIGGDLSMVAAGFRREFALGTVCGVVGRLRMEIRGDFFEKCFCFSVPSFSGFGCCYCWSRGFSFAWACSCLFAIDGCVDIFVDVCGFGFGSADWLLTETRSWFFRRCSSWFRLFV